MLVVGAIRRIFVLFRLFERPLTSTGVSSGGMYDSLVPAQRQREWGLLLLVGRHQLLNPFEEIVLHVLSTRHVLDKDVAPFLTRAAVIILVELVTRRASWMLLYLLRMGPYHHLRLLVVRSAEAKLASAAPTQAPRALLQVVVQALYLVVLL